MLRSLSERFVRLKRRKEVVAEKKLIYAAEQIQHGK